MAIVGLSADWLFHIAQVGLLLSNVFASILLVRIFLFLGFFILGLWGLLVLDAYAATVAWMSVFCAINLVHIARIIYQMRKITLPQEEEELFTACFQPFGNFDRSEFHALYGIGHGRFCDEGELLLEEGQEFLYVGILVRGRILKLAGSQPLNAISRKTPNEWALFGTYGTILRLSQRFYRYEFISSFMPGGDKIKTHLTRKVGESNTKVHMWEITKLKKFLEKEQVIKNKLMTLLCVDLTRKLGGLDDRFRQHHAINPPQTDVLPIPKLVLQSDALAPAEITVDIPAAPASPDLVPDMSSRTSVDAHPLSDSEHSVMGALPSYMTVDGVQSALEMQTPAASPRRPSLFARMFAYPGEGRTFARPASRSSARFVRNRQTLSPHPVSADTHSEYYGADDDASHHSTRRKSRHHKPLVIPHHRKTQSDRSSAADTPPVDHQESPSDSVVVSVEPPADVKGGEAV